MATLNIRMIPSNFTVVTLEYGSHINAKSVRLDSLLIFASLAAVLLKQLTSSSST